MHQQPRDQFQQADPYQQQALGAPYQQPLTPPPGAPAFPRQAPARRPSGPRRTWPYVLALVAVAVISFAAGEAAGKSGNARSPSPAASAPPAATTQPAAARTSAAAPAAAPPAPAAARPHVIARFTGSGTETTSRFTVAGSGNWELKWSYDCSAFGSSGNFIVSEDNGNDLNGADVNELGPGGHGVTHVYGDSGTHFLSVNSECSWKATAISQP